MCYVPSAINPAPHSEFRAPRFLPNPQSAIRNPQSAPDTASPPAILVLIGHQPRDAALGLRRVHEPQIAIRKQHLRRAIDRIVLLRMILIAEPQRQPRAVSDLSVSQEAQAAGNGGLHLIEKEVQRPELVSLELAPPLVHSSKRVRGEVGSATVER
jgi:hypothetical protein